MQGINNGMILLDRSSLLKALNTTSFETLLSNPPLKLEVYNLDQDRCLNTLDMVLKQYSKLILVPSFIWKNEQLKDKAVQLKGRDCSDFFKKNFLFGADDYYVILDMGKQVQIICITHEKSLIVSGTIDLAMIVLESLKKNSRTSTRTHP